MQISILANDPDYRNVKLSYDEEAAQNALRFHRTLPAYQETPLVSLSCAAELYRVRSIFVKDESFRFGLNAFKGLGGSYSMFRILCDRLSLDPLSTGYTSFMSSSRRQTEITGKACPGRQSCLAAGRMCSCRKAPSR